MLGRIAAAIACALLPLAGPATPLHAQPMSGAEKTQKITEALQQKLAQQGFTDVDIMPGSFVVTAKDKDGEPIALLIDPHSTVVLAHPGQEQAQAPDSAGGDKFKWY